MAAVHTLRLYFTDTTDKEVTYSYKYFDNTKTPQQVKTFGELLIVNNSIFSDPPAVLTGAEYVTTDTTAINLSSQKDGRANYERGGEWISYRRRRLFVNPHGGGNEGVERSDRDIAPLPKVPTIAQVERF